MQVSANDQIGRIPSIHARAYGAGARTSHQSMNIPFVVSESSGTVGKIDRQDFPAVVQNVEGAEEGGLLSGSGSGVFSGATPFAEVSALPVSMSSAGDRVNFPTDETGPSSRERWQDGHTMPSGAALSISLTGDRVNFPTDETGPFSRERWQDRNTAGSAYDDKPYVGLGPSGVWA